MKSFLRKIIFALLVVFVLTKRMTKNKKKDNNKNKKKDNDNKREHKSKKSHRKQDITYITSPSSSDPLGSYITYDPNSLYTPVTNGMVSSGGNIYQTNASAIPYGTGYSYGPWQKIPMK